MYGWSDRARREVLATAVADLVGAESLEDVQAVVRTAARRLVSADGATFVLKDGDCCFYADEDAASPLWKGQRFPLADCISGWAMIHGTPAVVPDITEDDRIPLEAYRPTFVHSLVMVPVADWAGPLGAIGAYWAQCRQPEVDEVAVLGLLAEVTATELRRLLPAGYRTTASSQ